MKERLPSTNSVWYSDTMQTDFSFRPASYRNSAVAWD